MVQYRNVTFFFRWSMDFTSAPMFKQDQLTGLAALVIAGRAVQNRSSSSVAGISQFFPGEVEKNFNIELLGHIERAKANLRRATVEAYDVAATKNSSLYLLAGQTTNVHQFAALALRARAPAFAFPASRIYVLGTWWASDTEKLRPGILVHEAFHLDFKVGSFGAAYEPVIQHSKTKAKLNAFAYQGFVCFVAGLDHVAPLEKNNGPFQFAESQPTQG